MFLIVDCLYKYISDNFFFNNLSKCNKFKLSIISLCLGATSCGSTLGWPLNSLSDYVIITCKKKCNDNTINGKETIHLFIHLSACIGALVPPCVADNIGRKHCFGLSAILCIISWLILLFANDNISIILGSIMGGLSTGIFVVTTTIYIAEILPSKRRKIIVIFVELFSYIGTFLSLYFDENRIMPIIMLLISILFLITIYPGIIECPYYLYHCNKTLEAKLALKNLHNVNKVLEIDKEYKLLNETKKIDGLFVNSKNGKKMFMNIVMMFLCCAQVIGHYAIDLYTDYYVKIILPNYGNLFVSLSNIISIGICIYLIGKIGKASVLFLAGLGYIFSCLILIADTFVSNKIYDKKHYIYKYLTAIVFLFYRTSLSLGLIPFIPLLTDKLFTNRIKIIFIGFFISGIYFSIMISQIIFKIIKIKNGTDTAVMSFSIIGSIGIIFFYLFFINIQKRYLNDDGIFESALPAMI